MPDETTETKQKAKKVKKPIKYLGGPSGSGFFTGVPARDLTRVEWEAFSGKTRDAAFALGLYQGSKADVDKARAAAAEEAAAAEAAAEEAAGGDA